ncbi:dihydropteroate synthase [Psychrobacter phenylpyruvicus]|uniref:Dihydropteroate synthase n=1 Tax=Psychrobacter phenylpyruvicus TaxID=29432 RepID=A0A379LLQ8_9GAMM|nr:dihydropteroate synthase [Psychrobacter phenylpyruvicus]SUD91488.1 Dihydropteroate synthase [Psychrobacter phenylpyruvicus]
MQLHPFPNTVIETKTITAQSKQLDLSQPHIMGILNVTPDSFSDGGKFNNIKAALTHCEQMLQQGATIIDIGGESTRPNASPVTVEEECSRVVPVVEAIRQQFGEEIWLSIDTSSPKVIEQAVQAGADIWNDVRALSREGATEMAAKLNIPVVLMHMRGEPTTMNAKASYQDVLQEVITELKQRIDCAVQAGVELSNIIIDPGFGFAKNYEHHKTLLKQLSELHQLQLPILFGISRKRFLGEVLNRTELPAFSEHQATDRDGVGMAAALLAFQQGASIVRTHNVGLTMQGLALWRQLNS